MAEPSQGGAPFPAGPPARRAPRRDATENRARLLQAGSDVFGEHGTDVSLELVAAEADLGMATLYRHFATKNDLVADLVRTLLGYLVDVAADQAVGDDGRGLERWLAEYADVQTRKRGLLARIWADDVATADLRTELAGLLAVLLSEAQAAGRIRPEATPADVLLVVFGLRGVAESTGFDDRGAWRRYLAVALAGLRTGGAALDAAPWTAS